MIIKLYSYHIEFILYMIVLFIAIFLTIKFQNKNIDKNQNEIKII
jgi:hypothetical protein